MPDIRRLVRNAGGRSLPNSPRGAIPSARTAAGWLGKGLFFCIMLGLLALTLVETTPLLVALLAGVALSVMLKIVLPTGRFKGAARALYSGEAGEEAYDETTETATGVFGRLRR
ncbi:hypothetical protein [Halomarina oriensis]|uniref:Uncharacterized protein n=1 Tax=Halomarina oriensis TaxID=671145 RepID=A0A6B0GMU3_9EURY|nr:hypothetical protein [Halomarina oriensis]MWG36236.1 hypothetical protein [Halomarina oriensis]